MVQIDFTSRKPNRSSGLSSSETLLFTYLAQRYVAQSKLPSWELCTFPGDSVRFLLPVPSPCHPPSLDGFPCGWVHLHPQETICSFSTLSGCLLYSFILNKVQGWARGDGGHGGRSVIRPSRVSRAGQTNFYHGVIGSWKFQLRTKLGGLV